MTLALVNLKIDCGLFLWQPGVLLLWLQSFGALLFGMGFMFSPGCCCFSAECGDTCNEGTVPQQFQLEISGVADGLFCSDCECLNGTWIVEYECSFGDDCVWVLESPECDPCGTATGTTTTCSPATIDRPAHVFTLTNAFGSTYHAVWNYRHNDQGGAGASQAIQTSASTSTPVNCDEISKTLDQESSNSQCDLSGASVVATAL